MPKGRPLDKDHIHQILWEAKDRQGRLKIHQRKFSAWLGITHTTLCRVLAEFEKQGRIKRVATRYRNVGIYQIEDPETWDAPKGIGHPGDNL